MRGEPAPCTTPARFDFVFKYFQARRKVRRMISIIIHQSEAGGPRGVFYIIIPGEMIEQQIFSGLNNKI